MFLNSHDKVTYNLMVTKREGPWAASLRSRHATSHDKAVLHPRRHQTVSSSEQESMAYASDEHCTSSRVAPLPLTQYPKPGGISFINVLTPAWCPWRSTPHNLFSLCSSKRQGLGTGSLSPSHPLCLSSTSPFPPCVGLLGVVRNARKGREGCSEERSPEDQGEEGVTIPSNTLLQKHSESDVTFPLLPPSPLPNKS